MKKTRFLALALVVAIALAGAGYAAWTDTLQINTTVKTGRLDVYFDNSVNGINSMSEHVEGKVTYQRDGSDNNDRDIANITLSNLYPGATADFTLKILNNSTIPVIMNPITYETSFGQWSIENFHHMSASLRFFDASDNPILFPDKGPSGSYYANPLNSGEFDDVELPIGGYATLSFGFKAHDKIDQNETYTINIESVFKQFNH